MWKTTSVTTIGLFLTVCSVVANPGEVQPLKMTPKIVNALETHGFPSVVWFRTPGFCTGTLIGCHTVLTAAHCVGDGNTAATCGTPNPGNMLVFAQHGKNYGVSSVAVHPGYNFAQTSDLAVLRLSEPVTGIAPSKINTTGSPAAGTTGVIAGFGLTANGGPGSYSDLGIKRAGQVMTATCPGVPDANHVCWNFVAPLGNPGEDSNTCQGDSGGPLFVDFGSGSVVAGVTSGGSSPTCLPLDASFDADVFVDHAWIESEAGSDINNTSCGSIPQAFEPNTQVLVGNGELAASNPQIRFNFEVPVGTSLARITLNGEEGFGFNDFDLYVKQGSPPTTSDFDCRPFLAGVTPEACEFSSPAAGTWHILVNRFTGAGRFQTTVTLFGERPAGCVPSDTTLCLNNDRFKVEVAWRDFDGNLGTAKDVGFSSDDSGLLYFFSANNWEMLIKVLNGCGFNDRYWVFAAATTDVEYTLTVTDTQENVVKTYFNPLGEAAAAITDTEAFATCP